MVLFLVFMLNFSYVVSISHLTPKKIETSDFNKDWMFMHTSLHLWYSGLGSRMNCSWHEEIVLCVCCNPKYDILIRIQCTSGNEDSGTQKIFTIGLLDESLLLQIIGGHSIFLYWFNFGIVIVLIVHFWTRHRYSTRLTRAVLSCWCVCVELFKVLAREAALWIMALSARTRDIKGWHRIGCTRC